MNAIMRHFPTVTDDGIAARAAIGLLVLATDQTIEHEYRLLCGGLSKVGIYESRLHNDSQITPASLRAMQPLIAPATALILPGLKLDVVGFGCTSATMFLGEEVVGAEIRRARPGIAFTTPITAAFAAFRALRAKRIAVLTPYSAEVNRGISTFIEARGFTISAMGTFGEPDDHIVARITPSAIRAAATVLVQEGGAEALFVSCTSLRLAEQVAALEQAIGIPATSSNHAMAWHSLRLAGVEDELAQFGQLFTCPLTP